MTVLVIYNTTTGAIIASLTLSDNATPTNGGLLVTIPAGKQLVRIDVSGETPTPVFANADNPIGDIYDALIELDHRITALEAYHEESGSNDNEFSMDF